ncbi:MAG: hypothetical protein PWP58_1408, partial [Bacillota bacterium]|nr:hypothetical protein [Bacillota bacterium]
MPAEAPAQQIFALDIGTRTIVGLIMERTAR